MSDSDPSREQLLAILDDLPWVVSYWDAEGRNVYMNRLYFDYLGRTPDEVSGRHLREIVGDEVFAYYVSPIESALRGEPSTHQRTWIDPDGRERHAEAHFRPHVEHGEIVGFVIAGDEITDRVDTQRALQEAARAMTLMQERQRMAADLHDLVIQRLFAAGLDLAMAQRDAAQAGVRVDAAARAIDAAISELRGTIYDLQQLAVTPQLPERIERMITDCGRVLGFPPDLRVRVDWDQVPGRVARELTAVLSEALSNVVKHADAHHVEVTLVQDDRELQLCVADDGRGLTPNGRISGMGNMRRRAEKLRGRLDVGPNDPQGTVLVWRVPL
ncbi:PAS domain-containing protein [Microbacterium sp.]|uniref:PAS domain-containing sensor histidine kinase n=1 Tax=Microbacterium sp. TaxID=51671 RepID=UPI003735A51A